MDDLDEVYTALVTGLRDYVTKNGFKHVGLGLSGGIDSALVAALAVDALGAGAGHLRGDAFPPFQRRDPGRRTDDGRRPRYRPDRVRRSPETMDAYDSLLGDDATGIAAENLQARIRGNLMMALSNTATGWC